MQEESTSFKQDLFSFQRDTVDVIRYGPRGVVFCDKIEVLSDSNPLKFFCSSCKIEVKAMYVALGIVKAHKKDCKNALMNSLGM